MGGAELAENSGSPELFQKCNWLLFLAGAWAAGGRGRGGTRCPGQTLPVGVGQRGWPRLRIRLPNNAEQQSATGSGDLNHVTFAPQVSCPRRAGGSRAPARLLPRQGLADRWGWGGVPCLGCPGFAGHHPSASTGQPPAVVTSHRPGSCCVPQGGRPAAEREGKRKAEQGGIACLQRPAKKPVRKKTDFHKPSGTSPFFPNDTKPQRRPIPLCCHTAEFLSPS